LEARREASPWDGESNFETIARGRRTVELRIQRPHGCVGGASRTLRVRRTFRCDTDL